MINNLLVSRVRSSIFNELLKLSDDFDNRNDSPGIRVTLAVGSQLRWAHVLKLEPSHWVGMKMTTDAIKRQDLPEPESQREAAWFLAPGFGTGPPGPEAAPAR